MYVVAGVTGHVGSVTARRLLHAGAEVRVLVRRHVDAEAWIAQGAQAHIASLSDQSALGEALTDCEGFFALLPFDLTVDDVDAHADALVASIAGAVAEQQVPHVVQLSSGGADLAEGTGPISGLHRLEHALLASGTTLTALRPGHFQEKIADVVEIALDNGLYPVFASSADVSVPMIATHDIGEIAAHALLFPPAHSESVDLIGPSYTELDASRLLGAAIGRELHVVTIPEEGWVDAFVDAGFRTHIAESLAELYRADERGLLAPRGDRCVHVTTSLGTTISQLLEA